MRCDLACAHVRCAVARVCLRAKPTGRTVNDVVFEALVAVAAGADFSNLQADQAG